MVGPEGLAGEPGKPGLPGRPGAGKPGPPVSVFFFYLEELCRERKSLLALFRWCPFTDNLHVLTSICSTQK